MFTNQHNESQCGVRNGYSNFGLRVPPMSGPAFIGFGGECCRAAAAELRLLFAAAEPLWQLRRTSSTAAADVELRLLFVPLDKYLSVLSVESTV